MGGERCRVEHLASGDYCEVSRCMDCGGLHLTMGSLTVRLPLHVVKDLAVCVTAALRTLEVPAECIDPRFQCLKN